MCLPIGKKSSSITDFVPHLWHIGMCTNCERWRVNAQPQPAAKRCTTTASSTTNYIILQSRNLWIAATVTAAADELRLYVEILFELRKTCFSIALHWPSTELECTYSVASKRRRMAYASRDANAGLGSHFRTLFDPRLICRCCPSVALDVSKNIWRGTYEWVLLLFFLSGVVESFGCAQQQHEIIK